MTYKEKLRLPGWQKKRLEILNRDEFKCMFCGDDKTELQIHHAFYFDKENPEDYSNEMLFTLCKNCHQDEEKLKEDDKMIYAQFLKIGISRRDLLHIAIEMRRYFLEGDTNVNKWNLMDFLYKD